MKKTKTSERKSLALKVVGTSAAIVVVASATGATPGVLAAAVLGAALALAFS